MLKQCVSVYGLSLWKTLETKMKDTKSIVSRKNVKDAVTGKYKEGC